MSPQDSIYEKGYSIAFAVLQRQSIHSFPGALTLCCRCLENSPPVGVHTQVTLNYGYTQLKTFILKEEKQADAAVARQFELELFRFLML